jgi:cytochrome c556
MDSDDFKKIEDMFKHHVGMMTEDFQHKLDIVIEGQQMLGEKVERLEARIEGVEENLGRRIDAVAADLSAHRADTEAHHGMYRVREGGD